MDNATTYTGADVDKTGKGGVDTASYGVDTLYFLLKLGADTVYFENTSGANLTIDDAKKGNPKGPGNPGQGGGLSHESQIGALPTNPINPIPLPAGLPLLLSGVGLIALMRARRKS